MRGSKETLWRYLPIVLSLLKLRIVVTPLILVLFGDPARLQHGIDLSSETGHLTQAGGILHFVVAFL